MSDVTAALNDPVDRLKLRLRQAWAVAMLDLARIRHGRHFMARLALLGLPVAIAMLFTAMRMWFAEELFVPVVTSAGDRSTPLTAMSEAVQYLWPVYFRFVLFVATLELFGGLVRQEFAEGTLHHLFLMPLRRETTLFGKYIAAVLLVTGLCSLSWFLATAVMLVPYGPGAALSTLFGAEGLRMFGLQVLMTFLAAASYGSLFLLAGLFMRSPVLVGVIVWSIEGVSRVLPQSFKELTLLHYVDSFAPLRFAANSPLATLSEPASPAVALLILGVFSALCLAASGLKMRYLQLSYGGSE